MRFVKQDSVPLESCLVSSSFDSL